MEKYEKPVMEVERIENDVILTSITDCSCNIGIGHGGGGSGGAR